MKAALHVGKERVEVREIPIPSLEEDECLVKVEACGICGSDRWWLGEELAREVQGHEISGTVAEVGEGVARWRVGDRVVVYAVLGCGECEPCMRGMDPYCLRGPRSVCGGFAEYAKAKARCLLPLDPSIDFVTGCLLTDNVGTPMRALARGKIPEGGTVAVWGLGPLGLVALQGAKALGAGKVIALDPVLKRREVARALGADIVLDPSGVDFRKVALENTNGYGVDLSLCTVRDDHVAEDAASIVRRNGWFVSAAGRAPIGGEFEIYASGVWYFAKSDYAPNVELVKGGLIDLKPIVTHTFPLERIQEAFATRFKKADQAIKVVVTKASSAG
ncbi:MAG: alcohol dehydrogenase catalytic domain-containing protein [Candidatus Brockarchaeota archaeon]|nr:alcohol dehydrogenase catalytic domain-containing protein [Candidatus Brockarchaeota archaeon]